MLSAQEPALCSLRRNRRYAVFGDGLGA